MLKHIRITCQYLLKLVGLLLISHQVSKAQMIFSDSFERSLLNLSLNRYEACCPNSITIVDSLARSGKSSIRFELNDNDSDVANSKRSEIIISRESTMNIERWVKFSTYWPAENLSDNTPEIIAQWHANPDKNLGESWRSPPISLRVQGGNFYLDVKWAKAPVNSNHLPANSRRFLLGKCINNKWQDWVFHIKYSYGRDGILEVWKNGQLLVNYNGPNYYNDVKGPFMKIGLYKWVWKMKRLNSESKKRVIFFDDVVVSKAKLKS